MKERIRRLNDKPQRPDRKYVLYWMQTNRRADSNHALAAAVKTAGKFGLPVLVYEGLTSLYPLSTARNHAFILANVPETEKRLKELGIGYVFYLRRGKSDANDTFYRLAADAATVITDDYPTFLNRAHNERVPAKLDVACYAVDSACVVPMSRMEKREYAAYTIRPKIKKALPDCLEPVETEPPGKRFRGSAPGYHREVVAEEIAELVSSCEVDHSVEVSLSFQGGRSAALRHLEHFLENNLERYGKERNEPTAHATSNLSPYLRHGMISALEVALAARSYGEAHGVDTGEFLEELIVRRELAFNFARFSPDPTVLETLPDWARKTLREHDGDKRDPCYSRERFEKAETHDELWNSTQKEMMLRGKIHGYYRMYWGKKIIEWAESHQAALETMIYIHDRYALDGRDPNTYTGILWCFGLHDRPWRKRPVFGSLRYMSYDGMKRKTAVDEYIREIRYLEETGVDPHRIE